MTNIRLQTGQHQRLQQSQQHRLVLTQELKQSLQILRMSGRELEQYLEQQAQHNPLIELEPATPLTSMPVNHNRDILGNAPLYWNQSLEQFLLDQLRLYSLPPSVMQAAQYIAGSLQENGYLTLSIEEISSSISLSADTVAAGLDVIQSLDPAGVGARTAKECLLLQIKRDSSAPLRAYAAVEGHIEQIAQGKTREISESMGISLEQTEAIIHYIRTALNPRPASEFASTQHNTYIMPDASFQVVQDQIQVSLNSDRLPKLSINPEHSTEKLIQAHDKEATLYWQQQLRAARILITHLEQRNSTLGRVLTAIAEEQQAFILLGDIALRPLSLKTLASQLDLHPSTISRAIRHKYVQTPHGVYALKQLLSTGLSTDNEAQPVSAEHIKQRIRQILAAENNSKPYSDRKLAELLQREDGIILSRRTVTKYREQLRILASPYRKRRS
jgi:RNA polymerase sigma-54 factor